MYKFDVTMYNNSFVSPARLETWLNGWNWSNWIIIWNKQGFQMTPKVVLILSYAQFLAAVSYASI